MAKGLFQWLPHPTSPEAKDPGGRWVPLREGRQLQCQNKCSFIIQFKKFYIEENKFLIDTQENTKT